MEERSALLSWKWVCYTRRGKTRWIVYNFVPWNNNCCIHISTWKFIGISNQASHQWQRHHRTPSTESGTKVKIGWIHHQKHWSQQHRRIQIYDGTLWLYESQKEQHQKKPLLKNCMVLYIVRDVCYFMKVQNGPTWGLLYVSLSWINYLFDW